MHCGGLVAPTGRAPVRPFQPGSLGVTRARVCRPFASSLFQSKSHGRHGYGKGQYVAASAEGAAHTSSTTTAEPVENLVIVGSGPAGYTAAIYAARANLRPLMYEGYQAGGSPGGQLMTTSEVENFPGFPEGVSGPELMDLMRRQAERWGTRFLTEDVERIDFGGRGSNDGGVVGPLQVQGTDTAVTAHALVVATGATARRLGLPSEAQYWSRGISACAICDGASPLFRGQEVVVVGGGDTALEEALYLLKYATRVHLLVRGDTMRASMAMQQRVLRAPRVSVRFQTVVVDAEGDGTILTGVQVRDTATGKIYTIPARGLFYGIGHEPNSGLLRGAAELDSAGYVVPAGPGGATTVPGVFVAGDLQDKEWRQAVTAAGSGCAAALAAERWLAAGDLLHAPEQAGASTEEEEEVVDHESERKAVSTAYHARDEKEYEFDARETLHRGQYALRKLYHESPLLLAVLYTAPSCAPCRTVKPILRKLVSEYRGKMHLVEIDIEEDPEIAQAAGVTSTPTLQFFKNKKRILHSPGVKMKREYRNLIESNL